MRGKSLLIMVVLSGCAAEPKYEHQFFIPENRVTIPFAERARREHAAAAYIHAMYPASITTRMIADDDHSVSVDIKMWDDTEGRVRTLTFWVRFDQDGNIIPK